MISVKISKGQMRSIKHVIRRGKTEDPSLTGSITRCRARGKQREKYMDAITRTVEDGSKAAHILQMTRDRSGNPWSPMFTGARHFGKIK